MSDTVIDVQNLGKRYRLGEVHSGLLSHRLDRILRGLLRMGRGRPASRQREAFWALRDVSFDVPRGQVLGIVGRNGAGKSTLLKILSRITEPTEGRVELRGRVASLLEVGTGFHPELTGRENIFLNGAILGMTRSEIVRRFDRIVAFAEIDRFIDTPVKRYSSGMHVRLAFAVAAHLEPEILLVDEVLAVGDAGFQKKCLGRMNRIAGEGRTVLFVSHNMPALTKLCQRVVWLDGGRCVADGEADDVVGAYLRAVHTSADQPLVNRSDRTGTGRLQFTDVWFEDRAGRRVTGGVCGDPLDVVLTYRVPDGTSLRSVVFSIGVYTASGIGLADCRSDYSGEPFQMLPPVGQARLRMPRLPLLAGQYWLNLFAQVNGEISDWIREAVVLPVADGDYFGTGRTPLAHMPMHVDHAWRVCEAREEAA